METVKENVLGHCYNNSTLAGVSHPINLSSYPGILLLPVNE